MFPYNNSRDKKDRLRSSICEDAFRQIPHFADARLLAAQAIFRGQSNQVILGKRKALSLSGLPRMQWWVPTGFKQVDPRRFTIRPIRVKKPDGSFRVRGELYMSTIPMQGMYGSAPTAGKPDTDGLGRPLSLSQAGVGRRDDTASPSAIMPLYRKVLHPEWFLRVVYGDEEARLGYGYPLADVLYFYSWVKQVLIREGLQGIERWSQGVIIGKLDPDRVGSTTQTMEDERQALLDSLTKMRSRHVIVVGQHDEVQALQTTGAGHQIVTDMIAYVDDCIMAVCTGAILMSSKSNAGSLGSLSRDEVGRDTQRGVLLYDKNKIDEDITQDLIGLFERMNWTNLSLLGLADCGKPEFKTVGAKVTDPDRAMSRFAQLATIAQTTGQPIRIRVDEFFEQIDLTPVGPDDDFIEFGSPQMGVGGVGPLHGPGGKFAPQGHAGPGGPGGEEAPPQEAPQDTPPEEGEEETTG